MNSDWINEHLNWINEHLNFNYIVSITYILNHILIVCIGQLYTHVKHLLIIVLLTQVSIISFMTTVQP